MPQKQREGVSSGPSQGEYFEGDIGWWSPGPFHFKYFVDMIFTDSLKKNGSSIAGHSFSLPLEASEQREEDQLLQTGPPCLQLGWFYWLFILESVG